jgi:hypothetical protein
MSVDRLNKYEIRHRALLEVVRICGGVTAYSKAINTSRSRASNWVNNPEMEIPYEYLVLTEDLTHVSIERLSPFTEAANKVVRRLRAKDKPLLINIELGEIAIGKQPYIPFLNQTRSIIVGTDGVLISGLTQLEAYKASGTRKVQAVVLDLEALILEKRALREMAVELLLSERIAIALRLSQLFKSKQFRPRWDENKSHIENRVVSFCPTWDETRSRTDEIIARLIDLNSKSTYHRAKQVYLKGTIDLISMVDGEQITIGEAAKIAKLSSRQQFEFIQVWKQKGENRHVKNSDCKTGIIFS